MKLDIRVNTWGDKYRNGTEYWYVSLTEYRKALTVKTRRPFTKKIGFVRLEKSGPFATRAEALEAGRAGREAYLARLAGRGTAPAAPAARPAAENLEATERAEAIAEAFERSEARMAGALAECLARQAARRVARAALEVPAADPWEAGNLADRIERVLADWPERD